MLACPPVKGSRLQRVVLFFFFFSSPRVCSLTFFLFYLNKIFSALVYAYVCSFCVLCLAAAMTDQMQSMYVSPLCCLPILAFFFFFFIIILIPSSSKRKKKNEWLFFFLFTQTNSVDSFSITNIFYHPIY
jgi:hypothetical protein